MAADCCSVVSVAGTGRLYPVRSPEKLVHWGQQGERHQMPRTPVYSAMSEHLPIGIEVEFTFHQPVGELSRLDRKRADVAGDLLIFLAAPLSEDHLENTVTGFIHSA